MEGFSSYLSEILSNYTYDTLRQITKKLNSTASKKLEMISSIISYLVKPENHDKLTQVFPAEIQADLLRVLPDKQLKCICDDVWKKAPLVVCVVCNKKQHSSCIGNLVFEQKYYCVSCQMKKLNPADEVLDFLVYPFLVCENRNRTKNFMYSKSLKNEINEFKNGIEVQFRCVKVQAPGFQICWPKRGTLYLNQKPILEFKDRKHKKETSLDMSIMLTLGNNEISLEKRNDTDDYCLAVVKVKKLRSQDLLKKLSSKTLALHKSLDLIKSFFKPDKEVKPSLLKISLRCQFTLQPIKIPARGKKCNHQTCFDLQNFVEQQQIEKFTWRCPICTGPAFDVVVDEFLLKTIEKHLPKKLESVQMTEDYDCIPDFIKEETQKITSSVLPSTKINKRMKVGAEIISLEEDSQLIVLD
jgi:hypothetical protein